MTQNPSLTKKEEYISFREDMDYILNLANLINKKYSENEQEKYYYIKKLRISVDNFNNKYEGIFAAVKKTSEIIYLKFFLKKESINEVFDEFLKEDSFLKERIFNNKASLQREFKSGKSDPANISEMLALKKNRNRNMIELVYREDTLRESNSPEFRLLVSHALNQRFNREIDIKVKEEQV